MRQFFTFRFQPTAEAIQSTVVVSFYILILGAMLSRLVPISESVAGNVVTLFYLAMFSIALFFVRWKGSFTHVGITRQNWLLGAILGLLLGGLGLLGTINSYPDGSFQIPAWRSMLSLIAAGLSGGFIEILVINGYFQFRWEEAFGPIIAVIGSALSWTLAHGVVMTLPGAGTYVAQEVGITSFLVSIFVMFFILGLITHFTRNIWAGVILNAVTGNIFTNLYMLSIMPEQVFIANPGNLPIALFTALYVITGLALTRNLLSRSSISDMALFNDRSKLNR